MQIVPDQLFFWSEHFRLRDNRFLNLIRSWMCKQRSWRQNAIWADWAMSDERFIWFWLFEFVCQPNWWWDGWIVSRTLGKWTVAVGGTRAQEMRFVTSPHSHHLSKSNIDATFTNKFNSKIINFCLKIIYSHRKKPLLIFAQQQHTTQAIVDHFRIDSIGNALHGHWCLKLNEISKRTRPHDSVVRRAMNQWIMSWNSFDHEHSGPTKRINLNSIEMAWQLVPLREYTSRVHCIGDHRQKRAMTNHRKCEKIRTQAAETTSEKKRKKKNQRKKISNAEKEKLKKKRIMLNARNHNLF